MPEQDDRTNIDSIERMSLRSLLLTLRSTSTSSNSNLPTNQSLHHADQKQQDTQPASSPFPGMKFNVDMDDPKERIQAYVDEQANTSPS
jgi:hypothetical protein